MRNSLSLGLGRFSVVSVVSVAALASLLSKEAKAEGCPPGAFCEPVNAAPAAGPGLPAPSAVAPPAGAPSAPSVAPASPVAAGAAPAASSAPQAPPEAPRLPPQVLYQAVPPAPPAQGWPAPPPPPPPTAKAPRHHVAAPQARQSRPTLGINLRMQALSFGNDGHSRRDDGMGGLGLSFRYRPVRDIALDVGLDALGGRDYNGFRRSEVPFSIGGLFYLNPRDPLQVYLATGLHWSRARVESDVATEALGEIPGDVAKAANYRYFGVHAGLGLEGRLSRSFTLNGDLIGIVRSRTDDGTVPEYVDPETGRTTDTSGAALLRFGGTYWW